MDDVWGLVPALTTTEALCLLALDHIEEMNASTILAYIPVDMVAATTGLSTGTAGDALRKLARHGHIDKVPYLSETSNGRPVARIGYRLPEEARR